MTTTTKNAKPATPAKPEVPAHVKAIQVYFDVRDCSYWFQLNHRYVALKKSDLFMHLRARGLRDTVYYDGQRELDWPLYNAQINSMIDYAGSLAGHRIGCFRDGSSRLFLITDQANGVWEKLERDPKPPPFFWEFVQELLPDDQWQYFCYWLAIALRSLRRGDFRPGQVILLAGPAQCGKSLLQCIITEILGGRSSDPFRYMMGLTQFNKDLCGAEHWQIEDPATTTDIRARRQFGAMLKACTVNRDFSIHQKGKDALTLPIFRRVSISVNNEPENLAVCPPLDPSIEDKIFMFRCEAVKAAFGGFRMPTGELDRAKIWERVRAEVPGIRAWLLKTFRRVPANIRDDRFGVKAWHHPELRSELASLAPETRLLQLIDQVMFTGDGPFSSFHGKHVELEMALRKSEYAFEVEKVLRFVGACGSYLGKLARTEPYRVSKHVKDGYTHWTINPPPSMTGR